MPIPKVPIFVSSPGDVTEERVLAACLLKRLKEEFAPHATLQPIFWEHEPLEATESFQPQIPRPSKADLVICILWARLGHRLPANITRPDGSRYASGTEFEFEDARQGRQTSGKPDLWVYRKTAEVAVSLGDTKLARDQLNQKEALDSFCYKWFHDPVDHSLIGAFHPFKDPAEFEDRLEEHLRKWLNGRLPGAESDDNRARATWKTGSPFRGLEAFQFEHAPVFFGRTRAVSGVLNALRQQEASGSAFVLVLGMSGCGKSSLVRAGVLPLLSTPGVVEGIGLWRRAILRPGDSGGDLFRSLAAALLRPEALPELGADGTTDEALATQFRSGPHAGPALIKGGLSQAAATMAAARRLERQPSGRLALVVDQLEEIFTQASVGTAERTAFIEAIAALAKSRLVWILATMRNDFYPRCAELPTLVALKSGLGQYDLLSPDHAEVAQMIRRPARAAGLRFEVHPDTGETLDDLLLAQTIPNPKALPLMEFALEELYKRRTPDGMLTHDAYGKLGGVEGAVARRADETLEELERHEAFAAPANEHPEDILPQVFCELVTVEVGEEEAIVRKSAGKTALTRTPQQTAFVEAFIAARLLVADRPRPGDRDPVVSIAHEALLRSWPRLAEWIKHARDDLRLLRQVRTQAVEWDRNGRPEEFLWPEKGLPSVYSMLDRLKPQLNETERCFLRLVDSATLLDELNVPSTTHARRAYIGDRLAKDGDVRPGVGLRKEDGLPDIAWCEVPGGNVALEGVEGVFRVEPFFIAKYPITWIQYRTFVEAKDGYHCAEWWQGLAHRDANPGTQYRRLDNHPAEDICWYDAVAFCRWLSAKLGYEVRLPTEWEWQQAATGGNAANKYPWGATWDSGYANTEESGLGRSTAVGMYPQGASPVGALDLIGNVWEWCVNEFEVPSRVELSGDNIRAVRGGSANFNQEFARADLRERDQPKLRSRNRGLRLAKGPLGVSPPN